MGGKRCYALLCTYDGAPFAGFQRQPPLATVQGALEDALAALSIAGRVEGSSRTDAGVHARRQIVTLRVSHPCPAPELPRLLARRVPRALSVLAAAEVDESFHARHSAVAKVYRYVVVAGGTPTEWERRSGWTLPDARGFPGVTAAELDEGAMRETLTAATGRRDFSALVHPNASGKRVRLLTRAELVSRPSPGGGRLHELTLAAPGFLRHQIRNLVGLATAAGLGLISREERDRLLSGAGDRWRGARAPGRGLTLWDVQYRRGEDPFRGGSAPRDYSER